MTRLLIPAGAALLNIFYVSVALAYEDSPRASDGMAARLACNINQMFQSNLGLMVGLVLGIMGLVQIIKNGAYKSGLVMILAGALFTAIPSLIASALSGLSEFLMSTNISEVNSGAAMDAITMPSCESIDVNYSDYNEFSGVGSGMATRYGGSGVTMTPDGGRAGVNHMTPEEEDAMPSDTEASSQGGCGNLVRGSSRVTSGYGMRTHPISGRKKLHAGVDYAAPAKTPIFAAASGRVSVRYESGGCGHYVVIDHGGGTQSQYCHMYSRSPVANGSQVSAGQQIGMVGSTGGSTGNHLHFAVKQNGRPVNPASSSLCKGSAGSAPATGANAARS